MKILCIGDSLGLPREGCDYESTWFYKLKKMYPDHEFIAHFKRGLLIDDALHMFDTYYCEYASDFVILQTGICDCSPRYINERKILWKVLIKLSKTLDIEHTFWVIIKKCFKRREQCVYTSPSSFYLYYSSLISKFVSIGVKKIIIVKIGHSTSKIIEKNPCFNINVDKYNSIIDEIYSQNNQIVSIVKPLDIVDDSLFVDGYHCSPKGMDRVLESLINILGNE